MPRNFEQQHIDGIVAVIEAWHGEIDWESVCRACKKIIGRQPTWRALAKYDSISEAFRRKKKEARSSRPKGGLRNTRQDVARDMHRLREANKRLSDENTMLRDLIDVLYVNARRQLIPHDKLVGIRPDMRTEGFSDTQILKLLLASPGAVDRGRSDGKRTPSPDREAPWLPK